MFTFGGSEARARSAAVLLLALRGTPFLYAGEELGLENAEIPDDRVVDPGGRDGCRAPIPWDASAGHGWAGAEPWLPWPPEPDSRCAAAQRSDPASILHLYRRLLAARRGSDALRLGSLEWIDAPEGVLAWRREQHGDARVIVVNFTEEPRDVPLMDALRVEIASDGEAEGDRYRGRVGADQALILA